MKTKTDEQEIIIPNGSSILDEGEFPFWTTTEHGIKFSLDVPREDWLKAVHQLTAMHESSGRLHFRVICILADALNQGEELFKEEFAQAISDTRKWMKVGMKTIQNAMWIMKSVDASRRRESLSLAHHEVVAPLDPPEQDELLGQAEEEDMSVADLKKVVAERHPKTKRGKERKTKETNNDQIANLTDAKNIAVMLSNYLTANEDKIKPGSPLFEVMGHINKLWRRIGDKGRKR